MFHYPSIPPSIEELYYRCGHKAVDAALHEASDPVQGAGGLSMNTHKISVLGQGDLISRFRSPITHMSYSLNSLMGVI